MNPVAIPRTIINQILTQAQAHPDNEVCGLISGKEGSASRCFNISNIATDPSHLYRMDPKEQIDAMRNMRDNGEELFAIYHSHPDSPAQPSATDMREANYPEALYLIVSLGTTGVLEMRGFRLRDHEVESVDLVLA